MNVGVRPLTSAQSSKRSSSASTMSVGSAELADAAAGPVGSPPGWMIAVTAVLALAVLAMAVAERISGCTT